MNGTTVLKRLIPTNITCETLITYDSNGSILAKNGNIDVNYDLNTVLNLNNEVLKKNRRIVIDLVKEQLNKEKPHQKWTKELFDKHKERWLQRANDKYRQFCMIAVWFLDNLRMKPQYL